MIDASTHWVVVRDGKMNVPGARLGGSLKMK
jgi:hypothetical protein